MKTMSGKTARIG